MELHQINLNYLQEEDRILLRASFRGADGPLQEVRAWLTRRMVRRFWEAMVRALETQVALDKPQAAHAKTEILGMEHEASLARNREQGSFTAPYETSARILPLGEDPILIASMTFNLAPGKPVRINLAPAAGTGFEIALPRDAVHGFCKLLVDTVERSDWDLDLHLPQAAAQPAPAVLN